MAHALDLDPRLGQADAAHRPFHRLRQRRVGRRRGLLDRARAGDPLALARVGGQPDRAPVLGQSGIERVLGRADTDVLHAPFHGREPSAAAGRTA